MTRVHAPVHGIEIRLNELPQLFNSMDPTPFHHKDLDRDAADFIESWALESPKAKRFRITVHLGAMPREETHNLASEAIANYYSNKADMLRRTMTVLLQEGRTSLVIGTAFLCACLFAADLLAPLATGTFLKILRESLTIGGWVAMWRPMQIFLYDWWPLARRGRVYRHLAHADVRVIPAELHAAGVAGAWHDGVASDPSGVKVAAVRGHPRPRAKRPSVSAAPARSTEAA